VADRFPDGQLYTDLRAFGSHGAALSPAEAVRGFLDALGVPPERVPPTTQAQVGLYRSLLAGKRVLIVLDNARDADQVRPLLPGAPGCVVVVTSRNRLASLVAVDDANTVTVEPFSVDEGPAMLARRLGDSRVAAEPDAVTEIVSLCAGLPLALAIVAARSATRPGSSLADLAGQLRDARALDALRGGDSATDVRAVFSWSYAAVSRPAARVFRLLGLHPGADIGRSVAASLAGLPPPAVEPLLAELTDAHLLAEHGRGRYALHDLLRAYAAELAEATETAVQRRAALHRLLDHYVHTAARASRLLDPHDDPIELPAPQAGVTVTHIEGHREALDWFTGECSGLLAAVVTAVRTAFDRHACQLAAAVMEFLQRRGHWHDLTATQRAALDAANRLADRPAQARAHLNLARAHAFLGRYDDARCHLLRALELFRKLDDLTGQANTHLKLGGLLALQGRHDVAVDHACAALDLFRAVDHRGGIARALNNVGWYQAHLGDHRAAVACCRRALHLHRDLGDRRGQADTWDSLGYAHHRLGRHRQAAACYRRALALYRDLGDRHNQACTLVRLGDAGFAAQDRRAAGEAWQDAFDIFDEFDHPDAAEVNVKLRQLDAAGPPVADRRRLVSSYPQ
jgi:tetratricopeptide (TPR) repeat protein